MSVIKIKTKAKAILELLPDGGGSVKRLYWQAVTARRLAYRALRRLTAAGETRDPDPVFWIDPKRIKFMTDWKRVGLLREDGVWVFDPETFRGSVSKER